MEKLLELQKELQEEKEAGKIVFKESDFLGKDAAGVPRVLTVEQAAKVIGVSRSKMYKVIHSANAPNHIRIGAGKKGSYRIGRDALYKWLDDAMSRNLVI